MIFHDFQNLGLHILLNWKLTKVYILRFWQGKGGSISGDQALYFVKKYIAPRTWLITDGARGYLKVKNDHPGHELILYQLSHNKGEYARQEVHITLNGRNLGSISMSTNDVDGGWSQFRDHDMRQGGNSRKFASNWGPKRFIIVIWLRDSATECEGILWMAHVLFQPHGLKSSPCFLPVTYVSTVPTKSVSSF